MVFSLKPIPPRIEKEEADNLKRESFALNLRQKQEELWFGTNKNNQTCIHLRNSVFT